MRRRSEPCDQFIRALATRTPTVALATLLLVAGCDANEDSIALDAPAPVTTTAPIPVTEPPATNTPNADAPDTIPPNSETPDTDSPAPEAPTTTAVAATVGTHTADHGSCGEALDYRATTIGAWNVCVAGELDREHPELAARVFTQLSSDLAQVSSVLPVDALAFVETVPVWVEYNSDFAGAVYHSSAQWLTDNGYPPEWAGGIQLGNADNYLSWIAQQPAIVLHELAHALHDQVLGDDDVFAIAIAYSTALESGTYSSVEYIEGGLDEAYATTNDLEYFAELTEALFWVNDYFPFDAQQLSDHDPTGDLAVRTAWGLND